MITALAAMVGMLLGMRYRVISLVPATIVGGAATGLANVALGHGVAPAVILFALSLQAGYLAGLWVRARRSAVSAPRYALRRSM